MIPYRLQVTQKCGGMDNASNLHETENQRNTELCYERNYEVIDTGLLVWGD